MELTIQIVGEDLAQVDFGERNAEKGRSHLFIGIQKGQEVIETVPATAECAAFTAVFSVSSLPDGSTNFLGLSAHGTRTARFCYLAWLIENEDGNKTMFSRIKLPLSHLRWSQVMEAAQNGKPLVMRLSLRGQNGRPVCASVPDDLIRWEW